MVEKFHQRMNKEKQWKIPLKSWQLESLSAEGDRFKGLPLPPARHHGRPCARPSLAKPASSTARLAVPPPLPSQSRARHLRQAGLPLRPSSKDGNGEAHRNSNPQP